MDGNNTFTSMYNLSQDAYSSFMHKHLQYYGYFSGRTSYFRQFQISARLGKGGFRRGRNLLEDSDSEAEDDEAIVQRPLAAPGSQGKLGDGNNRVADDPNAQTDNSQALFIEARQQVKPVRFGATATVPPRQAPLWPIELDVLPERVKHIDGVILKEPLFAPISACTGRPATAWNPGRIVFHYDPPTPDFFMRSRVSGSIHGPSLGVTHLLTGVEDTTLLFESRFESGNLARAVQVGKYDYELWMRPDLYTRRHTQWYYFRVGNTRAHRPYRFTIVNFYKSDSLYNYGMKPLFYSERDARQRKVGWRRLGDYIRYYQNNGPNSHSARRNVIAADRPTSNGKQKCLYSLTFTFEFPHDNDTCYFAHCYPYTYSDLMDYLDGIYNDCEKSKLCKIETLCKSIAGNAVHLLTISEPAETSSDEEQRRKAADSIQSQSPVAPESADRKRPVVVFTARVHPGETNSSWIMKGLLDFLLSASSEAKLIRSRFVFKIVPMLNPDGVIVGNYRCCLAGQDLNRKYRSNLRDAYPSVWHTRQMVKELLDKGTEIAMYCDLHGHSQKQNVFMYGCAADQSTQKRCQAQLFPFMLSRNAAAFFDFDSCRFKIEKGKLGTGRIAIWQLGVANSFTMEASFCGSSNCGKRGFHYSTLDYEKFASEFFLKTLYEFSEADRTKLSCLLIEIEEYTKKVMWDRLMQRSDFATVEHLRYSEVSLAQLEKLVSRLSAANEDSEFEYDSDSSEASEAADADTIPSYMQPLSRAQAQHEVKLEEQPSHPQSARTTVLQPVNTVLHRRSSEVPHIGQMKAEERENRNRQVNHEEETLLLLDGPSFALSETECPKSTRTERRSGPTIVRGLLLPQVNSGRISAKRASMQELPQKVASNVELNSDFAFSELGRAGDILQRCESFISRSKGSTNSRYSALTSSNSNAAAASDDVTRNFYRRFLGQSNVAVLRLTNAQREVSSGKSNAIVIEEDSDDQSTTNVEHLVSGNRHGTASQRQSKNLVVTSDSNQRFLIKSGARKPQEGQDNSERTRVVKSGRRTKLASSRSKK